MSCRNAGQAFDLRCYIREEMMNYIAEAYDIKDNKIWEKIYDLNFNRKELHK